MANNTALTDLRKGDVEFRACAIASKWLVTVTLKDTDETVIASVPNLVNMNNPETRLPLSQREARELARLLRLFARSLRE